MFGGFYVIIISQRNPMKGFRGDNKPARPKPLTTGHLSRLFNWLWTLLQIQQAHVDWCATGRHEYSLLHQILKHIWLMKWCYITVCLPFQKGQHMKSQGTFNTECRGMHAIACNSCNNFDSRLECVISSGQLIEQTLANTFAYQMAHKCVSSSFSVHWTNESVRFFFRRHFV